jgi:hypothetical protein
MLHRIRHRVFGGGAAKAQPRYHSGRPLCFMHIPKASGTSFISGLSKAISREPDVSGFDRVLFGGFDAFDSFSFEERRKIFEDPAALPKRAGFVAGHFAYSTLRHVYPNAQMITVFREPFTRVMSLWMFWRTTLGNDMSGIGLWADYVRHAAQPLTSFLDEPRIAAQTDNMILRQLLWPHEGIPVNGFIDPADDKHLLRLARHRLQDFSVIGIVEQSNLVAAIEGFLGQPFTYPRVNETDAMPIELRTPFASELDHRTLNLLDARSRLDLALWSDVAGLPPQALSQLRRQTILRHVARCGALMAR